MSRLRSRSSWWAAAPVAWSPRGCRRTPHGPCSFEAGPDLRRDVPAHLRDGWGLSRDMADWGYTTEPSAGGEGQKLRRGKLLGGTSWLTRFAVRGSPADFDAWAALGNAGWSFDEVLPYLREAGGGRGLRRPAVARRRAGRSRSAAISISSKPRSPAQPGGRSRPLDPSCRGPQTVPARSGPDGCP